MDQTKSWFNPGILLCLLLVLLLQIYPLPDALIAVRPQMVLMLCAYLVFRDTIGLSLEFACVAGLILDLISGGELGRHGLALLVPIAILKLLKPRIHYAGLFHEMLIIGFLTLISELILQSLNLVFRETVSTDWIIFPAIASLFIWPVLRPFFLLLIPDPHT